jgi:hypothetical protein
MKKKTSTFCFQVLPWEYLLGAAEGICLLAEWEPFRKKGKRIELQSLHEKS